MTPALTACMSVVYSPRVPRTKFYDPKQVELSYEDVDFYNADGTLLAGWWFDSKTKPAKGTVVFFHGNGENLTTHFLSMSWLPAEGYNYFIFDYPGYGVSDGVPSPDTVLSSGKAAIQWVHDNKDSSPLIIYGQSLGGNIAHRAVLDMKDQIAIKALILDGTFLSYRSVGRDVLSRHWLTWLFQPLGWLLMSDTYAPKDLARRGTIPLLVMHGQKDSVVMPKFGEQLYNESPEPKTFWKIEKGHHGDSFWGDNKEYRQKLLDFLAGIH